MLKAKVKIIDFGFARYLKKEELAFSTLGSPINMDPRILRKLNKLEHPNEYGYDQKADIWSLGTLCYEMLIGKNIFDADSMKDLVKKVNKGDYFVPTTLSKEAVSFLNGMLQYDLKKRLSAEQLYRHKFINKRFDQLTKIDLKEIKKNIKGSKIRINSKMNQSIWDVFGDCQCSTILEDFNQEDMIEGDISISINRSNREILDDNPPSKKEEPKFVKLKQEELEKKFRKIFELVNDDFIFIEPKLIPIIPGDDPNIINKVSEFTDDTL